MTTRAGCDHHIGPLLQAEVADEAGILDPSSRRMEVDLGGTPAGGRRRDPGSGACNAVRRGLVPPREWLPCILISNDIPAWAAADH